MGGNGYEIRKSIINSLKQKGHFKYGRFQLDKSQLE